MKYIIFLLSTLTLFSCSKKNDLDYYIPQVEMVSAKVLADGKMEFIGRLLYDGHDDILYLGFCADTAESPRIYENQVRVENLVNNTFTAVFESEYLLNTENSIYVNAFATGNYAFAEGEPILLDKTGGINFPAPCEQDSMTITIYSEQNIIDISPITETSAEGVKKFTVSFGSNVTVTCYYTGLNAGIYNTVVGSISLMGDFEMQITVNYSSSTFYPVYSEQEVYISSHNDNLYEIEICDATFGSGPNLNMRFTIESP